MGGSVARAACLLATAPLWADDAIKAARIPFKPASAADDSLVFRAIAAFLLAAAAAYGLAWCIKRFLPGIGKSLGQDRQLTRLEAIRLTPRSTLVRVRYGDEELLLGESEHGVTLLAKKPAHRAEPQENPHEQA
ncbi:MAG: flagellar biosynthetic protein FliO [Burkholderiales bacterium]|nr:flagellar biosynthetic protein FliO [Burkholderiales bacterium]